MTDISKFVHKYPKGSPRYPHKWRMKVNGKWITWKEYLKLTGQKN